MNLTFCVVIRKQQLSTLKAVESYTIVEMLRIPHSLDNLLTGDGKVVTPTHRPLFAHQKHYFSASGTQFC
jgi:hypothetical protein